MAKIWRHKSHVNSAPGFPGGFLARFGLYREPKDPFPFLRAINAPQDTAFPYLPTSPSIGVHSHINTFQFNSAYDVNATSKWAQGVAGSGTALTVQDARGGKAKFTNGTSDNNYYCYQSLYEIDKMEAGKGCWIRGSIQIADVDEADWYWGLCARLAGLNSNEMFDARVDGAGFYGADGSANINCESRKDSTATQSTGKGTLTDATETWLGMHFDGVSAVDFYINFAWVARVITNLNDNEETCISFGCRNGKLFTGTGNTMQMSGILLLQDV